MNEIIRSWFVDLQSRMDRMITDLDQRSVDTKLSSNYKSRAILEMTRLKTRIELIIKSKIPDHDFFTPNLMVKYNLLHDEYLEAEKFLYLPFKNYDDKSDKYFELLIRSIYAEASLSLFVPFITCSSNSDDYFWTYSKYNIIGVPQGEERHLKNLSDIYHEIGHLFFSLHKGLFLPDLEGLIDDCYDRIIRKSGNKFKRAKVKTALHHAIERWNKSWLEEIACDMIATYLVGPAYAWANLKVSSLNSGMNRIYAIDKEHPGDAARMKAMVRMLELTDCKEDASEIEEKWKRFSDIISNDKHQHYEDIYCADLIRSMAEKMFEFCTDHGLVPYKKQIVTHTNAVSGAINDACAKIRKDPDNYPVWEVMKIEELHSQMMFAVLPE